MRIDEPYRPPASPVQRRADEVAADGEPIPIGGWLKLLALLVILAPLLAAADMVVNVLPYFRTHIWNSLTHPESSYHHPLWASWILFRMVCQLLFILWGLTNWFLFFQKRRALASSMTALLIAVVAFEVSHYALSTRIPAMTSQQLTIAMAKIIGAATLAMICVPYLLSSRRVKHTFLL